MPVHVFCAIPRRFEDGIVNFPIVHPPGTALKIAPAIFKTPYLSYRSFQKYRMLLESLFRPQVVWHTRLKIYIKNVKALRVAAAAALAQRVPVLRAVRHCCYCTGTMSTATAIFFTCGCKGFLHLLFHNKDRWLGLISSRPVLVMSMRSIFGDRLKRMPPGVVCFSLLLLPAPQAFLSRLDHSFTGNAFTLIFL